MATATGVEHMSEKQGASKDESSEQSAVLSADRVVVDQLELVDREDKSFHVIRPGRIEISQLGRPKQDQWKHLFFSNFYLYTPTSHGAAKVKEFLFTIKDCIEIVWAIYYKEITSYT